MGTLKFCVCFTILMLTISVFRVNAETIPASVKRNYVTSVCYTADHFQRFDDWKEVCSSNGWEIANPDSGRGYCVTRRGNIIYIQTVYICADGSDGWPYVAGCSDFLSCPNLSWSLSTDQETCSRPDSSCILNPEAVSEEKLLAAIAYGESSTLNNYEEMAAIASATLRRRDAARMPSTQALIKKYTNFTYVAKDGNARYRELMCAETEATFEKAYDAARNALTKGVDYANGGCFWDGYDLKTRGSHHNKYLDGFLFTDSAHNIFSVQEPPAQEVATKYGRYDHLYDSTAAYGRTIFWKLNKDYLKARKAGQCL